MADSTAESSAAARKSEQPAGEPGATNPEPPATQPAPEPAAPALSDASAKMLVLDSTTPAPSSTYAVVSADGAQAF